MPPVAARPPQQGRRVPPTKTDTREFRRWEGVNVRDSRTGIGDTEFSWLQNMIPVGAASLQVVRAPGDVVATYEPGLGRMWGFNVNGFPVLIAIGLDGSIHQYTGAGAHVEVAPPGTVGIHAWATCWQASPVLIVDPLLGYFTWNGAALTLVDATLTGQSITVFEGRVWIARGRTIIWSAPNSYDDFSLAAGGGSLVLSDSTFQGDIRVIISSLQQLWIVGASAINAISNVQTSAPPLVITTFSVTNIVSNVGSALPASVMGYFRALTFGAQFGIHALSGVTPQKVSEKLDGLSRVAVGVGPYFDQPAAMAVIEDNLVLCYLINYIGREVFGVPRATCPVSLLICFFQGKWFFAYQGQLAYITTLTDEIGTAQTWGHDGTNLYQCFGADACTPVLYKAVSKLYDFGSAVTEKALMKVGIELRAQQPITCDCASHDIICFTTNECPPPTPPPPPPPAVPAMTRLGAYGGPLAVAP